MSLLQSSVALRLDFEIRAKRPADNLGLRAALPLGPPSEGIGFIGMQVAHFPNQVGTRKGFAVIGALILAHEGETSRATERSVNLDTAWHCPI